MCARAEELVFIAPTNHLLPLVKFDAGKLSGGILKDVGEAIAQRMGRQARFLVLPSKRVSGALARGEAQVLCYALPYWIDGDFLWTKGIIPNDSLIVAHTSAPAVSGLQQLAGQKLGTVLGYRYPQLAQALGTQFVRDDARTMQSSIDMLANGRMKYGVSESLTLNYLRRVQPGLALRVDLQFDHFVAQCAFSRTAAAQFPAAERAIASLQADGTIARILAHYR